MAVAVLAAVPVGVAAWPGGEAPVEEFTVAPLPTPAEDLPRVQPLSRSSVERGQLPIPSAAEAELDEADEPDEEDVDEDEDVEEEAEAEAEAEEPEPEPEPDPVPEVVDSLYVTAGLNVRSGPGTDHEIVTVLARGSEVGVTGTTEGTWTQVVHDGEAAWVSSDYLSDTEPAAEASGGLSTAACASGSAVESGLTPDAVRVHRAVCAEFPSITSYGGVRSGGTHGQGRALDIMVSDKALGDSIIAFLHDNYRELGISELIWWQRIWTVQRASDGWRQMEDRGSATANHYDHIHVTVYGDSGG